MKRMYAVAGLLSILSFCALAQPEGDKTVKLKLEAEKVMAQVKAMNFRGMVMGPAVKGAPYSAVEVSESTQVLGDGTRIHNERQTTVYRDSEGRVRRETPDEITIMDPVAGVSYVLNSKDHSARKMGVSSNVTYSTGANAEFGGRIFTFQTVGPEFHVEQGDHVAVANSEVRLEQFSKVQRAPRPGESLGKKTIEGVVADGTRRVENIEVGVIGNDRPIQVVNESWYSPDLQTVVQSKHSDPRTGEETFRLTNVVRVEPPANLFEVPPDYKLPPPPPLPERK